MKHTLTMMAIVVLLLQGCSWMKPHTKFSAVIPAHGGEYLAYGASKHKGQSQWFQFFDANGEQTKTHKLLKDDFSGELDIIKRSAAGGYIGLGVLGGDAAILRFDENMTLLSKTPLLSEVDGKAYPVYKAIALHETESGEIFIVSEYRLPDSLYKVGLLDAGMYAEKFKKENGLVENGEILSNDLGNNKLLISTIVTLADPAGKTLVTKKFGLIPVLAKPDGDGWIMAGTVREPQALGATDVRLIALTKDLKLAWTKDIDIQKDNDDFDFIHDLHKTSDGSYFLKGTSWKKAMNAKGGRDTFEWLALLDENGGEKWENLIPQHFMDSPFYTTHLRADGELVTFGTLSDNPDKAASEVAGAIFSMAFGGSGKTDMPPRKVIIHWMDISNGKVLRQANEPHSLPWELSGPVTVMPQPDSEYLLFIFGNPISKGKNDEERVGFVILRVDDEGKLLWEKAVESESSELH